MFTAYDAADWYDHDLLEAYHDLYGAGSWPCVAIAVHSIQPNVPWHVEMIDWVIGIYDQHGYKRLPVWITEYMTADWWTCDPAGEVAAGVWAHYVDNPRVERLCWFPARWDASWTDPGGRRMADPTADR